MSFRSRSKVKVLNVLPVFRPSMGQEEIDAVAEVLRSGWIGLGPKTEEFEKKFAKYIGVNHAIALSSGTAALHLSLIALGIGKNDEVLVPSLTFVSCSHAILYVGAKPVFVDVDEETLCIDPKDVERKVSKKAKAIITVDYGGHPAEYDKIFKITKKRKIALIEDASHATGSSYKGKKVGSFADLTCFSFHAVKNLATGDGGMVTTNNSDLAKRIKNLRWVGIDKNTWEREELIEHKNYRQYGWYYDVIDLGYKYHMNDIGAAIGLVQLKNLEKANKKRRKLAARYSVKLKSLRWLKTPTVKPYAVSAWHNYVIRTKHRDKLNLFLKEKGISTGVHYMPIHKFSFYKSNKLSASVPVTDRIWQQLLTLPLYPTLSIKDQNRVIRGILQFALEKRLT